MTIDIGIQELSDKRQSEISAALSLLTGTDWPPESNDAVQDLLQVINKLPDLPSEAPVNPVKDAVVGFVNVLEGMHANLKKASEKYGRRERGLRDGIKYDLSSLRPGKCTDILRTCRDDIEKASTKLRENCLNHTTPSGPPAPIQALTPGLAEERNERNPIREGALIAARKTFKTVEAVSDVIPGVGGFVGVAAKVGLAFVEIIETMDSNEDVSQELASHTTRLSSCLQHFKKKFHADKGDEVVTHINDLHKELERVQKKVSEWNTSGRLKKAFLSSEHAEELKAHQGTVQNALEEMQLLVSLKTADLVVELRNFELRAERTRLLDRLGDGSYGAIGNAIEEVVCLPGTRVELLDRIDDWIKDTSPSADRVLWIRGMAGRGKSTIASTVAQNWASKGSCAIFHFRRGQNALDGQFICALARQLGKGLVLEVRDAILDCVRENEDIGKERLEQQFRTLFVGSLGQLQDCAHPIVIIVDALDECKSVGDAVRFVRLIDQHSPFLPRNVKFLLTCRPEAPLIKALVPRKWHAEDLDTISHTSEDITRFIRHSLTQIRDEHDLPSAWPASTDVACILEMSQGLFQWARTAIAYVSHGSPLPRLRELLQHPSQWGGLDDLYHQILLRAFKEVETNSMRKQMLSWVLGTLVVAPHPVTLEVIAFLYADHKIFVGQDDAIELLRDTIADLNSLLHVPASPAEPVRLMHTSIRDLLTAPERCINQHYFVNPNLDHSRLASVCLEIMERDLKQNICNLSDTPMANSKVRDVVDTHLANGLRYCCRSWSTHLTLGVECSEAELKARGSVLAKFNIVSDRKILSWLEVMSLIGAMPEAYTMAKQLYRWLREWPRNMLDDSLSSLWNDTQRFIAAFFGTISSNALDIYASALPRCPVETKLWLKYGRQATRWNLRGGREQNWSAIIWTAGAGSDVNTVAFSPDGSSLVSGLQGGGIRFWDLETGAPLGDPLSADCSYIRSVVFSPNGKLLASGSLEKTVQLWDVQTRAPLGDPLTGHDHSVLSVVFSPDGKLLASGSHDKTARLWDVQTRAPLGDPLIGHDHSVLSVVFSPDGKLLASGSHDNTIRLWDVQTRAPFGNPLTGHHHSILSVTFSPDGKLLASGSHDNTVRLWDTQTGAPLGDPLNGQSRVWSVAFSPDGGLLVSGLADGTFRWWDVKTRAALGEPLTGRRKRNDSVVFSRDTKLVAFESYDKTVQLWNWHTRAPSGDPLIGHDHSILSVAFSPDGKVLASGSHDKTVRLWEVKSRAPLGNPLIGHDHSILSVVFSPDGRLLASGSHDHTIRLWSVQTSAPIGNPLTGHDHSILSVVFSPDGKLLASGSLDKTIRLWDVETGAPLGDPLIVQSCVQSVSFEEDGDYLRIVLEGGKSRRWNVKTRAPLGAYSLSHHFEQMESFAFSPDYKLLASWSYDETVRLRGVHTGASLDDPLDGHGGGIHSVVFSPDGEFLASGSYDKTVRLWDARTRAQLGNRLTGHRDSIGSVVFSPDGNLLASASRDGSVRLWDGWVGVLSGDPLTGSQSNAGSLAFSPDCKILASGLKDYKIQLWDVPTGAALGDPLTGHSDIISSVVFSPDGKILASGSFDRTVRLWDVQIGAPLGDPLFGQRGKVNPVVFSPDGKLLASGSSDSTVQLWDVQTGAPLGKPFTGHRNGVRSLAFSPDGKLLASGLEDSTVQLWDAQTGAPLGEPLTGHDDYVMSVVFSPNSKLLASGSADKTVRLWDVQTRAPLGNPLTGHTSHIVSLHLLEGGKILVSVDSGGTVRFWDPLTRQSCTRFSSI